jgi:hypothetical protein
VWQVVLYNHPLIRVRHKDGETVEFTVSDDGTVQHGGARFDLGEAQILVAQEIAHEEGVSAGLASVVPTV